MKAERLNLIKAGLFVLIFGLIGIGFYVDALSSDAKRESSWVPALGTVQTKYTINWGDKYAVGYLTCGKTADKYCVFFPNEAAYGGTATPTTLIVMATGTLHIGGYDGAADYGPGFGIDIGSDFFYIDDDGNDLCRWATGTNLMQCSGSGSTFSSMFTLKKTGNIDLVSALTSTLPGIKITQHGVGNGMSVELDGTGHLYYGMLTGTGDLINLGAATSQMFNVDSTGALNATGTITSVNGNVVSTAGNVVATVGDVIAGDDIFASDDIYIDKEDTINFGTATLKFTNKTTLNTLEYSGMYFDTSSKSLTFTPNGTSRLTSFTINSSGNIVAALKAGAKFNVNDQTGGSLASFDYDSGSSIYANTDAAVLDFTQAGAGNDIDGTASTWYVSKAGAATFNTVTASTLASTVAIGTPPMTVTSTTAVTNLNADLLDGNHSTAFMLATADLDDVCANGCTTTPGSGAMTINNDFTATGTITAADTNFASGTVNGDFHITGKLWVDGAIDPTDITYSGTLYGGDIEITGTATAAYFAGDGSRLTGISMAAADEIASGSVRLGYDENILGVGIDGFTLTEGNPIVSLSAASGSVLMGNVPPLGFQGMAVLEAGFDQVAVLGYRAVTGETSLQLGGNGTTSFIRTKDASDNHIFYVDDSGNVEATGTLTLYSAGHDSEFSVDGSGNVSMDGDIIPTGDDSGLLYGFAYADEMTYATASAIAGEYYVIVDSEISSGATNSVVWQNDKELKVLTAGTYLINWSIDIQTSIAGKHIIGGIGVNDTIKSEGKNHADGVTATAEIPMAGNAILTLSANDRVSIMIGTPDAGKPTLTVGHYNLSVTMIGG